MSQIFDLTPCVEQSVVMESLGFTRHPSADPDRVAWVIQPTGSDSRIYRTWLHPEHKPAPHGIAARIADESFREGQKHRSKALNDLLQDR